MSHSKYFPRIAALGIFALALLGVSTQAPGVGGGAEAAPAGGAVREELPRVADANTWD